MHVGGGGGGGGGVEYTKEQHVYRILVPSAHI